MIKNIPFLHAKHFRRGPRAEPIRNVVIHSAEIGESLEGAEALMRVCAVNPRVASWHYAVDSNSITQSLHEGDIAFHAPGANATGIGIELSGRAKQSEVEWFDDFSREMLVLCAELVADICRRHDLPIEFVDAAGLVERDKGITTHAEVSKAFKKSDHTDPGPHFPMGWFLEQVRFFYKFDTEPAPAPEEGATS